MTKTPTLTFNRSDVCEEAHNRMLKDPEIAGGVRHSYYNRHDDCLMYTKLGQKVFNYYADEVEQELINLGYKDERDN